MQAVTTTENRWGNPDRPQYFYEPFLEAFDPALRSELEIPDGLADALLGADLRRAATERVFGVEILPAPYVVAHLQLGLLLRHAGAPLGEERAGVYLTNALTGWEPEKHPKILLFPEMQAEHDAADRVKQQSPILVILGNPPYNGFAGMAVRRIVEKSGRGVVCFISNYSWLDGLSFTGMRERYLEAFDRIDIDCLNGDKYKTGKLTPEGKPDPSVFSTEQNREGIQVGTAIATLVRTGTPARASGATVRSRHFWGANKRGDLLAATEAGYAEIAAVPELGLTLFPATQQAEYFSWPQLPERLEARLTAYFSSLASACVRFLR